MVTIPQLWLPILVAAVVVLIAGALSWTLLPAAVPRGSAHPVLVNHLLLLLVYALVIAFFVAYLTGRTVPPGAEYKSVFRVAATTAVLAFAAGQFYPAVRGTRTWEAAGRDFIDGVVFGLLTGGPFAAFWPEA